MPALSSTKRMHAAGVRAQYIFITVSKADANVLIFSWPAPAYDGRRPDVLCRSLATRSKNLSESEKNPGE